MRHGGASQSATSGRRKVLCPFVVHRPSGLGPHAVEHSRHLGEPRAVGLVALAASPLADVLAQEPVKTDGGQRARQGQATILEHDQCPGRVGAPGEHAIDRDSEHTFRLAWVAVAEVPQAQREIRSPVHAGSPPLRRASSAGGELIEELL